jgi:hypothetical protein
VSYLPPAERPNGNDVSSLVRHLVDVARGVRLLFQGKTNNVGEITLTANTTTTTLSDRRLTVGSFVAFDPMTANAAADVPYALAANRNNLVWTLTHSNAATTDRTFRYVIVG